MEKWKQKRDDHTTCMTNPVSSVVWMVWHRIPKLKRSLLLKAKKNQRKNWRTRFTNPDVEEENFYLWWFRHWSTWVADLIEVQTLSKQNKVTIHIGRDRCLFQVRVGPAVKKENRKRCDGCVRKKYSRKPREGNFRRYRQMQVRNFTIRPFKHWWKHRRFITFLPVEMPKSVSSNDLIEPLNRNCIAISRLPIHSNM